MPGVTLSAWIDSASLGEGFATALVTDDWLQGRSAFGGLQAVTAWLAMRTLVPGTMPLRALQMNFIAPVPAGALQAEANVLRVGKSVTQVEARLLAGGQRCASAVGLFGAARASQLVHRPVRPDVTCGQPVDFPFRAGITPAFTQHFSARWLRGSPPFSGGSSRESVVELALHDTGTCSEAHVLAIADFIPPVALSMLSAPTPGSSLAWMLELSALDYAAMPLSGWRIDSEMVAAGEGYTSQSNRIWGPKGDLVALSRQSMVVFG
jgi:acyl-coenzyme A thioesterase PaaI-like protein